MARILVVEDCPDALRLVELALARTHDLVMAGSLAGARARLDAGDVDLALVDLALPDGSGFTLCSEVEADPAKRPIPVLFLSASSDVSDKVTAFRLGAEDFIEKPFDPRELRARVDARLQRRVREESETWVAVGDVVLDPRRFAAFQQRGHAREPLDLTPHEFRLLRHLADHRGAIVSRGAILETLWRGVAVTPRTVDTHLSNLRAKLRGSRVAIEPVRGVGYRLLLRDDDGSPLA